MSKVHTLPRAAKAEPAAVTVTKSVELPFVKSTPGTHVYGFERGSGKKGVCTQVYLRKDELGESAPASITLTVSYTA